MHYQKEQSQSTTLLIYRNSSYCRSFLPLFICKRTRVERYFQQNKPTSFLQKYSSYARLFQPSQTDWHFRILNLKSCLSVLIKTFCEYNVFLANTSKQTAHFHQKKRTKCSFFMNRLPNRQFPFGMHSGFVRDFTNDWQLTSGHSLKDNSEFTIIGLPHI